MSKFKRNDVIGAIEMGKGFDKATVLNVYEETKGKRKGQKMYLLKILNGTATIPVSAEVNYELIKDKK